MTAVLVAHAGRMGSTAEIAEVVGAVLQEAGFAVDVTPCSDVGSAEKYDAIIVGSALYFSHWERDAVEFLQRNAETLATRPLWLFQSGPCGDDADQPVAAPRKISRLARLLGADQPVTFGGRLDPARADGAIASWVAHGSDAGDFRNWKQIRSWAAARALEISQQPADLSVELAIALEPPHPGADAPDHSASDSASASGGLQKIG